MAFPLIKRYLFLGLLALINNIYFIITLFDLIDVTNLDVACW